MELGSALLQMAQAPAKPPIVVAIQRLNQAIAACPHEHLKQQMLQTLAEMLQNMGPRFSQLMGVWRHAARPGRPGACSSLCAPRALAIRASPPPRDSTSPEKSLPVMTTILFSLSLRRDAPGATGAADRGRAERRGPAAERVGSSESRRPPR
jgi:hypothetical protein